jgi:hypothetical protein
MRVAAFPGLLLGVVLATACAETPSDPPVVVDPADVRLVIERPGELVDSVLATLPPITVRTTVSPGDPTPVAEIRVRGRVIGEFCGSVMPDQLRTDSRGEGRFNWTLGELAGRCELRIAVLDPGGGLLLEDSLGATARPGRADALWIEPGETVQALDTLALGRDSLQVTDAWGNAVVWDLEVASGPVVRVPDPSDEATVFLIATNLGSGEVLLTDFYGTVETLALEVCPGAGGRRLLLLTRPGGPDPVDCPAG